MPPRLRELLDVFETVTDRSERASLLIDLADQFREVPDRIATRPFPEAHRVQRCESEAYVWAEPLPDGTLKYHFAVENPQGISARAMAVILDEALSGTPPEATECVPTDICFAFFGKELSMGKGQGLMGMVTLLKGLARQFALARDRGFTQC
ncbi:MAG: SufE family protein [Candidatus Eremiobacterota bacterium]